MTSIKMGKYQKVLIHYISSIQKIVFRANFVGHFGCDARITPLIPVNIITKILIKFNFLDSLTLQDIM